MLDILGIPRHNVGIPRQLFVATEEALDVTSQERICLTSETTTTLKRRGRPKGSKNKAKVEALFSSCETTTKLKRRGRPKGSKNKAKVEALFSSCETTKKLKRRGRPKGSKNKIRSIRWVSPITPVWVGCDE